MQDGADMTEQVLITIRGMQVMDEEAAPSPELITTGTYSLADDNVHQVVYQEHLEEEGETVTNCLMFSGDKVELKKNGGVETHLVFEKGKRNLTCYQTPYGSLSVEMTARKVEIARGENEIQISLEYGLAMNQQDMAECMLNISIQSNSV